MHNALSRCHKKCNLVKFFIDLHVKITKIKFGLKFISCFLIILVSIELLHFSIFRHIFSKSQVKSQSQKVHMQSTYVLQSTYWHCAWSIFKRKFSTSSRNLWKDATKMQLMVGQLTFFRCILVYKYQQHLEDMKEVSSGGIF